MKCNMMKWSVPMVTWMVAFCGGSVQGEVVDFEDLSLGASSYWNGANSSGGFTSGSLTFNNVFTDWGGGYFSWEGWAYSNMNDLTTPGTVNQYSAYAPAGAAGNYAVATAGFAAPTTLKVPQGMYLDSARIANTTYAYLGARDGNDGGAGFIPRAFESGDWSTMTIVGLDASGEPIVGMDPRTIYLGDYRPEASPEFILDDWTEVDLSSLRGAAELSFSWDSSITNEWGSVLPAYVAIDDITVLPIPVPEPSTLAMIFFVALALVVRRRSAG